MASHQEKSGDALIASLIISSTALNGGEQIPSQRMILLPTEAKALGNSKETTLNSHEPAMARGAFVLLAAVC